MSYRRSVESWIAVSELADAEEMYGADHIKTLAKKALAIKSLRLDESGRPRTPVRPVTPAPPPSPVERVKEQMKTEKEPKDVAIKVVENVWKHKPTTNFKLVVAAPPPAIVAPNAPKKAPRPIGVTFMRPPHKTAKVLGYEEDNESDEYMDDEY
jgi:hypothetical protein